LGPQCRTFIMSLFSTWNVEVASEFLENFCTPGIWFKKIDGKTLLVEFQGTKHSWDGEEYIDGCNRRRMVAIACLKAGVLKLKRSG
jgi:hypothetical protein